MITQTELAYLAGVIDSDGFITIRRHSPNALYPSSITFSESMGVLQTSPVVVQMFQADWGGTIQLRNRKPSKPGGLGWKTQYAWYVTGRIAVSCIRDIRPYLRLKTIQADCLLALRESKERPHVEIRQAPGRTSRSRSLNESVVAFRNDLWQRCRSLNSRRASSAMMFRLAR